MLREERKEILVPTVTDGLGESASETHVEKDSHSSTLGVVARHQQNPLRLYRSGKQAVQFLV